MFEYWNQTLKNSLNPVREVEDIKTSTVWQILTNYIPHFLAGGSWGAGGGTAWPDQGDYHFCILIHNCLIYCNDFPIFPYFFFYFYALLGPEKSPLESLQDHELHHDYLKIIFKFFMISLTLIVLFQSDCIKNLVPAENQSFCTFNHWYFHHREPTMIRAIRMEIFFNVVLQHSDIKSFRIIWGLFEVV